MRPRVSWWLGWQCWRATTGMSEVASGASGEFQSQLCLDKRCVAEFNNCY